MSNMFFGSKKDTFNVIRTERFVKSHEGRHRRFVEIKGVKYFSPVKSSYESGIPVHVAYRLHKSTGETLSVTVKPKSEKLAEKLGVERWWALDKCEQARVTPAPQAKEEQFEG
jgi:hypothetical protein